ncbi:MAG: hypothetical protein AAGH68_02975 [Pseudomonadota bacterium]
MTELMIEILIYLAIAAFLGLVLGYLVWGWGYRSRLAAARAEGAASARTSVDGSADLKGQLQACGAEVDRLEREVATLRHRLEAQQASPSQQAEADDAEIAPEPDPVPVAAPLPPVEPVRVLTPEPILADDSASAGETSSPANEEPTPAGPPPASLLAERPDEVDDLKTIKGVGPKMEGILNDKGVYLFHQVANFTPQDVAWVNEAIEAFPGRIDRDNWVGQAQTLYREKYGRRHDAH